MIASSRSDSLHQVCIGLVALENGDALKSLEKLVLVYEDQRAEAGKRKTTVTVSRDGGDKIFQGVSITDADIVPIKVVNVANTNEVLFEGTIEPLDGATGVELIGSYFNLETHRPQSIKVALEGSEIPALAR